MNRELICLVLGCLYFLIFIFLGYVIQFYPETIEGFDTSIQAYVRGDLPELWTLFFRCITIIANPSIIIGVVLILFLIFWVKKWKRNAIFLVGNLILSGLVTFVFKNIYKRCRPDVLHLVTAKSYSFPSGHALTTTLMIGFFWLVVVRKMSNSFLKTFVSISLFFTGFFVLLSRIYLGVHYPSDVFASTILGIGILYIEWFFIKRSRLKFEYAKTLD